MCIRDRASAIQKIVSKDFMPVAMKKISEALNWIVFNPVSYTHLDVYKRQGYDVSEYQYYYLKDSVYDDEVYYENS